MNIFATSNCPTQCAQSLDDLRVTKMVLETAQMLCTALRRHRFYADWMYKDAHNNHPCTLWAGDSSVNFSWLCKHGLALWGQHQLRRGTSHKSGDIIVKCKKHMGVIPYKPMTPFPNCTTYKDIEIHTAYRMYMKDKWNADLKPPKFSQGKPFKWMEN